MFGVLIGLCEGVVVEGEDDGDSDETETVLVDLGFELLLEFFEAVEKISIDYSGVC